MKAVKLTENQRKSLVRQLQDVKDMNGHINYDIEIDFDYDDENGMNSPTIHVDGFVVDDGYWLDGLWIEVEHSGWYDYQIINYNEAIGKYEDDVVLDAESTKILDYELANF